MPTPETAAIVALIGECGLRVQEASRLEKDLVDKKRRIVTVHQTKDSEPRHVPLSQYALETLMAVPNVLEQPYLIVNPRTGKPFCDLRDALKKGLKTAGLSGITLKSLRNFRATQWAMDGVDLRTIKELMGHSDIQITIKNYARFVPGHAFASVAEAQRKETEARKKTGDKLETSAKSAN